MLKSFYVFVIELCEQFFFTLPGQDFCVHGLGWALVEIFIGEIN